MSSKKAHVVEAIVKYLWNEKIFSDQFFVVKTVVEVQRKTAGVAAVVESTTEGMEASVVDSVRDIFSIHNHVCDNIVIQNLIYGSRSARVCRGMYEGFQNNFTPTTKALYLNPNVHPSFTHTH